MGSPTLEAMANGGQEIKYPADCYSPKFNDSYRSEYGEKNGEISRTP